MILDDLEFILSSDVIVKITGEDYDDKKIYSVLLKEDSEDSKIRTIFLTDLPKKSLIFRLDCKNKSLTKYISGNKSFKKTNYEPILKACDYVIIFYIDNIVSIILCEIKSDHEGSAKEQLRNSEIFVKYLLSILEEFGQYKNLSKVKFYHRILKTQPLSKEVEYGKNDNDRLREKESKLKTIILTPNEKKHVDLLSFYKLIE